MPEGIIRPLEDPFGAPLFETGPQPTSAAVIECVRQHIAASVHPEDTIADDGIGGMHRILDEHGDTTAVLTISDTR